MSAHFHFLDLRQQEKREGKRESEREQINCIILAYKLNPWNKCSGSAFCRKEGETANERQENKRQTRRDRSSKMKWKGWRERFGARGRTSEKRALVVCRKRWGGVMESGSAWREVDRRPVQVQWSGVFNLTWWTSYWKHHPPSSSFTTPTPFLTDRKPCDEAVFKVI